MWIRTKRAFVSVAQQKGQPNNLLVRSGHKEHLASLFPKQAKQISQNESDSQWELRVSRKELAKLISEYVMRELKYSEFPVVY